MMIRQSNLLKWTLSNRNGSKGAHRNWIHHPESLQFGHVVYLVKFLGKTEASQPKGIEVIKEGIQKLKFNHQLRRSEGNKIPKVELTVSVNGVAIQDPKSKQIFHQYPLHRISYCADDKADKKFFSFIAKEPDSDQHSCFVFISDKLAEEITLTIGQAFDLAYRQFLETSGRELEMKKRLMVLQKKIRNLEEENQMLQKQLQELQNNKHSVDNKNSKFPNKVSLQINATKLTNVPVPAIQPPPPIQHRHSEGRLRNTSQASIKSDLLCNFNDSPEMKKGLDNDFFNEFANLEIRQNGYSTNINKTDVASNRNGNDLFGANPFQPCPVEDPFGMGKFDSEHGCDLEKAIGAIDRKLLEMRNGFQRGISFGNDDFSSGGMESQNK